MLLQIQTLQPSKSLLRRPLLCQPSVRQQQPGLGLAQCLVGKQPAHSAILGKAPPEVLSEQLSQVSPVSLLPFKAHAVDFDTSCSGVCSSLCLGLIPRSQFLAQAAFECSAQLGRVNGTTACLCMGSAMAHPLRLSGYPADNGIEMENLL